MKKEALHRSTSRNNRSVDKTPGQKLGESSESKRARQSQNDDHSSNIQKIMSLDTRIKPTDAEILACAVEDNAKTLVTLDKILIKN